MEFRPGAGARLARFVSILATPILWMRCMTTGAGSLISCQSTDCTGPPAHRRTWYDLQSCKCSALDAPWGISMRRSVMTAAPLSASSARVVTSRPDAGSSDANGSSSKTACGRIANTPMALSASHRRSGEMSAWQVGDVR